MTGYFTGTSIVVNIIIPFVTGVLLYKVPLLKVMGNDPDTCPEKNGTVNESVTEDVDDEYMEEWDMKKHPLINAGNLAIALAVLAAVLLASVFVLNNKINTLYDATVNLQNQLNEYVEESGQ